MKCIELDQSICYSVAPLARVNKLFNACVKRPNVLGRLERSPHDRLKQMDTTKASAALTAILQQVRSGYPSISGINLGADPKDKKPEYVMDEHEGWLQHSRA